MPWPVTDGNFGHFLGHRFGWRPVFLMYHELELPGRPLRANQASYCRYVISGADFRQQLTALRALGFNGMSVGEALKHLGQTRPGVAITFDDGSESDLLAAAPALKEKGFNATFYIVTGSLGRPGYLKPSQLRELSDAGFEIGSHSVTHSRLTGLPPERLRMELIESKKNLEEVVSRPVDHFSCPYGRWSADVARMAREAGYRSVATSRIGRNLPTTDPYCLARVAVMRGTSLSNFERICHGNGLFLRRAQERTSSLAKQVLGNFMYEKARSVILAGWRWGDGN